MNKSDIRSAARTITELDATDVADATLDLYIKDGFDRIVALERRWPSYEASTTLTTTAGTRDYPMSGLLSGMMREVTSLVNSSYSTRLSWISYDQGEEVFIAMNADGTGEPRYYSTWGGNIQLWPKPNAAYTLLVRGYRKPTDWHLSDAVEVDADERLHRSLIYYTVAQLYQLQEDAEMSQFYRNTFDEAVRLAHGDIMRVPANVPLVLSGGDPRWWIE